MNQSLENKFIKFTDDYLETHNVLPKYNEIKTFYDSLPNIESHFKASKGWFEKFMLRWSCRGLGDVRDYWWTLIAFTIGTR